MKIALATRNRGKIIEITKILSGLDIEVLTLDDFPPMEMPPEAGAAFKENAVSKARFVAEKTGLPVLADDSGLEVDSLGGRPGVLSARYAGVGATDKENYLKLLDELKGLPMEKRRARFRCVIAFAEPDPEKGGRTVTFDGVFEGFIATGPKGDHGFGYDPVFLIPEKNKTAAELTLEEKNSISHRAMALNKLKDFLRSRSGGGG